MIERIFQIIGATMAGLFLLWFVVGLSIGVMLFATVPSPGGSRWSDLFAALVLGLLWPGWILGGWE